MSLVTQSSFDIKYCNFCGLLFDISWLIFLSQYLGDSRMIYLNFQKILIHYWSQKGMKDSICSLIDPFLPQCFTKEIWEGIMLHIRMQGWIRQSLVFIDLIGVWKYKQSATLKDDKCYSKFYAFMEIF